MLADALNRQREYEKAEYGYKKAISIDPGFSRSYRNLGTVLNKQEKLEEAIVAYQKALELEPTFFQCSFELGQIFDKKNKYKEAVEAYRQAVQFRPYSVEYLCNLGSALAKLEEWKSGISYCLKALEIQPDYYKAYYAISEILINQGHHEVGINFSNFRIDWDFLEKLNLVEKRVFTITSAYDEEKDIDILPVDTQDSFDFSPPNTLDSNIDSAFSLKQHNSSATSVVLVKNAIVQFGGESDWLIATQNRHALQALSRGNIELLIPRFQTNQPIEYDEIMAFILARNSSKNYFHWMIDVIPQLYLLEKSGISLSSINKFIVNQLSTSFQKESFEILDISQDKVISSFKNYNSIKAKKLLVPHSAWTIYKPERLRIPKFVCQYLREKFLPKEDSQGSSKPNRIYICRRGNRRAVLNEENVINLLSQYGFRPVNLESMTLKEQISLFASAEAVVAPHGAGLTNIIFCNPKAKIIELFSPVCVRNFYWIISNYCNLEYYYLIGENFDNSALPDETPASAFIRHERSIKNILVNIDSLFSVIKAVGLT
jgi:hypothetical protein